MANNISIEEVAKRLGISIDDVKNLVKQGILHPEEQKEKDFYFSPKDIVEIRSRSGPTLSEEAALVDIQIEREVATTVSKLQTVFGRISVLSLGVFSCLGLLTVIIAFLFGIYPEATSDFFGYYYRFNTPNKSQAASVDDKQSNILAAATGPKEIAVKTSLLADVLKPVAATSLLVVKATDSQKYEQIVTNPGTGAGSSGPTGSQGPSGPRGAAGLPGSQGQVGAGGTNGTNGSNATEADTLSSVTARGATTTTGVTLNGGVTTSIINGLSLATTSDGLTLAGGTTSRTLTLTGADITVGSTIKPTSSGALTIQSNDANTLTLDAGGASNINIGTSNALALTLGRSAITTTIGGIADVANLKIGSGTVILKHLSATATFDAAEIASSTCSDAATVTITGANIGDSVIASPTAVSGGVETLDVSWNSYVSSANTVTIRICSIKSKQDPPSQTWRVDVWQH